MRVTSDYECWKVLPNLRLQVEALNVLYDAIDVVEDARIKALCRLHKFLLQLASGKVQITTVTAAVMAEGVIDATMLHHGLIGDQAKLIARGAFKFDESVGSTAPTI